MVISHVKRISMSKSIARVLLRIPDKLKAQLSEISEREHRSLNKQIEFMLEESIEAAIKDKSTQIRAHRSRTGQAKVSTCLEIAQFDCLASRLNRAERIAMPQCLRVLIACYELFSMVYETARPP